MYKLKASFAGLLLIFIILVKPLGLNANYDLNDCEPLGGTCDTDNECCANHCDKSQSSDSGICKILLNSVPSEIKSDNDSNSTLNILNDVHCLPLGNDTCEEDKECCSKNCVIEHDDLYGVCKTPGTQPKSQENFFSSEGCRPLEYKMCEYNEDCCSYNCSKKHKDQKYGVCKILIFNDELPNEPISNLMDKKCMFIGNKLCERDEDCCSNNCFKEQDNQKYGICEHPNEESKSRSDKEALMDYFGISNVGCKTLGDNTCQKNAECCSSYCKLDNDKDIGVCEIRIFDMSNEETVDSSKNPDSTASNDIHDTCKHLGNNMCEADHDCCSNYCNKRPANAVFGTCDIRNSSRYKNGGDGIYEKTYCTYYDRVRTMIHSDNFDEDTMIAAHWELPLNSIVKVSAMDRHVAVRITERGDDINALHMSAHAASLLGINSKKPVVCALTILTKENCTPDLEDTCVLNYECCSQHCQRTNKMELGKCVPRSIQKPLDDKMWPHN